MPHRPSTLFTAGFTKKSAEQFFETLQSAGVKRVIDVRLHNSNQLAGFTKRDDLAFFLKSIAGIDYLHLPILAPSEELFDAYRRKGGSWDVLEKGFLKLMRDREIEKRLDPKQIAGACLLCSEDKPHHCHRRLVAEYLKEKWGNLRVDHLG